MDITSLSQAVMQAHNRIRPDILNTPLTYSPALSEAIDGEVYLKLESEQHTGSFKARGSLNKLLTIKESGLGKPVITASTGNHGLGFARAIGITGLSGTVYLPYNASQAKVKRLGYYPVTVERYGEDSLSTELYARAQASKLVPFGYRHIMTLTSSLDRVPLAWKY